MKHVQETASVKPKSNNKMTKVKKPKLKKKKQKQNGIEIVPKEETEPIPATRTSDEPIPKKVSTALTLPILYFRLHHSIHFRTNG